MTKGKDTKKNYSICKSCDFILLSWFLAGLMK